MPVLKAMLEMETEPESLDLAQDDGPQPTMESRWEAAMNDQHRVRSVTVPLPSECETAVLLLAQLGPDGKWRSGFQVTRAYDPGDREQFQEDTPSDPEDDEGYEVLGEAIADACNRANWWVLINSDDDDQRAVATGNALDAWLSEFDTETATESIFDDQQELGGSVPEKALSEVAAELPGEAAATSAGDATVAAIAQPQQQYTIMPEAREAWDRRKAAIEERIGQLAIEQANLKAALKGNRKSLSDETDELKAHILRGPEKVWPEPAKAVNDGQATVGAAADPTPACSTTPPVSGGEGSEPWRSRKIADLDGLTPKIVEILDGENIRTVGDWVDWPAKHLGMEYTQIKNGAGKLTEARYERIVSAMMAVACRETVGEPVTEQEGKP
jgi:hypothetical protein